MRKVILAGGNMAKTVHAKELLRFGHHGRFSVLFVRYSGKNEGRKPCKHEINDLFPSVEQTRSTTTP